MVTGRVEGDLYGTVGFKDGVETVQLMRYGSCENSLVGIVVTWVWKVFSTSSPTITSNSVVSSNHRYSFTLRQNVLFLRLSSTLPSAAQSPTSVLESE